MCSNVPRVPLLAAKNRRCHPEPALLANIAIQHINREQCYRESLHTGTVASSGTQENWR
jgi:hypothetical protein